MNTLIAVGGGLLGLLPFVFSPTRTFGRGGRWKYVGALLIIVSAMSLFWDVRDMTGGSDDTGNSTASAATSDADVKALESLFDGKN